MVRHKVLDAMGDFYLTGMLIQGRCVGHNIGHEFNNRLMRKLLQDKSLYELVDLKPLENTLTEATRLEPAPSQGVFHSSASLAL